jgi:Uma2 family endonuclease
MTIIPTDTRLISPAEFVQMIEAGIFGNEERLELLYGRIVPMAVQGDPHSLTLSELSAQLVMTVTPQAGLLLREQHPVQLPATSVDPVGSRPEPDLAIVHWPLDHVPTPADIDLIVEVADTSTEKDLTQKLALYAAAGIREYWVVDLPHRVVWRHWSPQPDGVYLDSRSHRGQERIESLGGHVVDLTSVFKHRR